MEAPEQIPFKSKTLLIPNEFAFHVPPGGTQTSWDNADGVINNFSFNPIQIQSAGELIYIGTSLHEVVGRDVNDDANYAIYLKTTGTPNAAIDIRVRRQDEDNYIAMKIDFAFSSVELILAGGGYEEIYDQATHAFESSGRIRYVYEVWMLGQFIYGFVNRYNIVRAAIPALRTEPGISLNFPTIDDYPVILNKIKASETEAYADPPTKVLADDPSDLCLQFRIAIKEKIENPSERTPASYAEAMRFYEQRNVGYSDKIWATIGYPIKKPSAEEWFGG